MSRFTGEFGPDLPPLAFRSRGPKGRLATLEGGKGGSSAPPPDPRLVEAQIRSMGIQDDAIKEVLGLAREMQPLQKEQLQFGLGAARQAFDDSRSDREYALGRRGILTGMQNTLVNDAKTFNTEDRREQLAAQASGDVQQAFGQAEAAQTRSLTRNGVNPNDGKFAAMSNGIMLNKALMTANAANNARTAARVEGRSLTDRATNALAGYPAFGLQTTGNGAQFAANGIGLTNSGVAGMQAGNLSAAQVAGQLGSNATSMYGQQANYKLGMDKLASENNPTATILGGAFKVGAALAGNPMAFLPTPTR